MMQLYVKIDDYMYYSCIMANIIVNVEKLNCFVRSVLIITKARLVI